MELIRPETTGIKTGARLLETLTSALYADPIVVFREYVQNAIDSFASAPRNENFKVDIFLDVEQKQIRICDNGPGIPNEKFNETMRSLGKSTKDGLANQIGFRGIGRLAGLSFCKVLHFINKANQQEPQIFSLKGEAYRQILSKVGGGSLDLGVVLDSIASTTTQRSSLPCTDSSAQPGFEVLLEEVCDDLMNCICLRNPGRGRQKIHASTEADSPLSCRAVTHDFIDSLSMLLPVPYEPTISFGAEIHSKYKEWFGVDLSTREFNVYLNSEQLFKRFGNGEGMDFRVLPIQIADLRDGDDTSPHMLTTIGLLWMRFDYVFKAVKQHWGIAVRSKNMLVRGGSVVAEEAAEDRDAITSYGQYLSAIKGVSGELLLETEFLSDNSRRDWFKLDKNSLQLRNQLCHLMNRMHSYRYKISRYMHNDLRTDADKQQVVGAYRELVSPKSDNMCATAVEQFIDKQFQDENANEVDVRADERDLLGYTTTQKRFYKTLMMTIYDYFEKTELTEYYSVKSHVLRMLNQKSINPDFESTEGET